MTAAHVCCRHTLAIYHGPTDEGTALRCIWCTQAIVMRDREWASIEEAYAPRRELPPAERATELKSPQV